jgi:branched-chain amino acid transport system substrate-binding protein
VTTICEKETEMSNCWWKTAGACIAGFAVAALGLAGAATAQDKIRIGVVLPLSGQFALGGQNVKRGYDLAAEDINKVGGLKGLGGAQIELVYADNQGKQEVAIGETERLIQQENVSAIMGSWHSATTIAGTQAAERLKTPWVIEVASADVILERGFKYVTRVNVKASWYGEAPVDFLDYAKSKLDQKIQRVAIMYVDDDWGRASVGKGTKEALKKHGYEIVADIAYPSASQDVTTYINEIKAAKPDAFVITSFPNDALLVGRTVEQLGLKVPIVVGVSAGYVLPTFRSNLGPASERWFVVGGWNPDIPGAKALADKYKQKYGTDMNEASALSYQTVLVLKEAIEAAKSSDREKINLALHQLKVEPGPLMIMPYSSISFDETGQNPNARELMMQIHDGQLVTVWPDQFASAKPLLPFRP